MWQNIVFSFLPMIYIIGFLTVIAKNLEWADSYMDLYVMGYAIAYPLMVGYAWVSGGCTDVRYLGASLEKPSFWPDEMN